MPLIKPARALIAPLPQGDGDMRITHTRLTAAEMVASHTTPVLLVPALGVSRFPLVTYYVMQKVLTGADYSAGSGIILAGGAAADQVLTSDSYDWTLGGPDMFSNGIWYHQDPSLVVNAGIYFKPNVALVGGTGHVDFWVYWSPIDLT